MSKAASPARACPSSACLRRHQVADPAVAGQQRQRLVGNGVFRDPLPLRFGIVDQGRRFDDALFEIAFLPVDVVFLVSRRRVGARP